MQGIKRRLFRVKRHEDRMPLRKAFLRRHLLKRLSVHHAPFRIVFPHMRRRQLRVAADDLPVILAEDKAVEAVCGDQRLCREKGLRADDRRLFHAPRHGIVQHGTDLQDQRERKGQSVKDRHNGKARARGGRRQREPALQKGRQDRTRAV